jgi:hypothetical protein
MTYEEAKAHKLILEKKNNTDSSALQFFERNAMGLIPDHVRETPEWKSAKKAFDSSFAELRNFNGWFVKMFKKEISADRNYKRYVSK